VYARASHPTHHGGIQSILKQRAYLRFRKQVECLFQHYEPSTIAEWLHGEQVIDRELHLMHGEWPVFIPSYFMEKHGEQRMLT
jgi:hypothetical protein